MFSVSGSNGGEPYNGICSSCSNSYNEAAAILAVVRATTSIPGVDVIYARIASLRAQGSFVS